jgi:HSP20 family protein
MKLESIKEGVGSFLDSVAEGWHHLRESAANALTRFKPSEGSLLPDKAAVDDPFYFPMISWSMLGGEVFEDETRVVVRLEVPGLDKTDLDIEVHEGMLIVKGEKRFERENTDGRWRVMQCAYGTFRRVVPLSSLVLAEQADATYKNGVLRIELPKAKPQKPSRHTIKVG